MAAAKAAPIQAAKPVTEPKPAMRDFADVHFAFNKWQLSDQARQALTEQSAYLKENSTLVVTIEGYADSGEAQSSIGVWARNGRRKCAGFSPTRA